MTMTSSARDLTPPAQQHPSRVILFAKAPVPGEVKTRLAATLGADHAAAFHHASLLDLGAMLRGVCARDPALRVTLAASGDLHHPAFVELRADLPGLTTWPQGEGDLGARMARAMQRSLEQEGDAACVVIGSDSPTLPPASITGALQALRDATHEVAIGPALDGGYYLIGARQSFPTLFEEIAWSSPRVFTQTLARCAKLHARVCWLPFWYDVDTLADLELLAAHLLDHLAHQHPEDYIETRRRLAELRQSGALISA